MTLQNRVAANGEIVAVADRGLFLGNRGGVIHDHRTKTLHPTRRWASRQWICCVLDFKGRQRELMSANSYTELFFMDEVTALAAGHRPCFECRRANAVKFALAFSETNERASAPHMDVILHDERLDGKRKKHHSARWGDLPAGAMIEAGDQVIAKSNHGPLTWSFSGYSFCRDGNLSGNLKCLTPPSILKVLNKGYKPHWHPSADLR